MSYRLFLVEDEELIGEMVKLNLEEDGYTVRWSTDGVGVVKQLQAQGADLIVLDVMLPARNGFDIAKSIRSYGITTPILMLTARADTADKVQGLDCGADDYLTKPFDMDEFLARVRALIRRSQSSMELPSSQLMRIGNFLVNFETRESTSNEGGITLSEKEAHLLEYFAKNPGRALSRIDILEDVWGMDATPTERTVDNFVLRLRKLFEETPDQPTHFLTMRAKGYVFHP